MQTGMLDIWGGGLLNALLPSFSANDKLNVNCAVMDFAIDGNVAKSNALFLDTRRITVNGEGQYNIKADNLDMKISPKTKDVSIGDIGAGVNLRGPLANPSYSVSALDISKKIGGLLLGAVNPAFSPAAGGCRRALPSGPPGIFVKTKENNQRQAEATSRAPSLVF